jgi:serine/threonine-protein kinase RsbW
VDVEPRIAITFPARPEFLRLARLTTADAASRAGFDYEQIDDLRIAVSELCTLVSGGDGASLTLDFALERDRLIVHGTATPGGVVENEFSRAIVTALVDEFEISVDGDSTRFRAAKRVAQPSTSAS